METQTNWGLVLLLWVAGLGAAAQYGKLSVVFTQLPQVYPDAGAGLGFILSLVGLLGIVFGVVAGVIVARFGFRRALLAGLSVGALMSFAQAMLPSLPIFLTTRVIEGAAHLAIVVAAPTMIAQICSEQDRGVALTLWGTFFGVAFAILGWLGLPLVNAYGVDALLLAHGLFMSAMAMILWRLLPTLVPQTQGPKLSEMLAAHLRIYSSPRIGAPALGWLFYTACFLSVLTVFPPFVAEEWRIFTIGAMPLVSIISSLTIGVALLRRFGAVSTVLIGFATCALCTVALMLLPGSVPLALALGAALGLIQGATFAAVPELNAPLEDRALANGGLAQMGNLGNTIGTPLMVVVIVWGGYTGLMLALTVVFLAGLLLHLLLARARLQSQAED